MNKSWETHSFFGIRSIHYTLYLYVYVIDFTSRKWHRLLLLLLLVMRIVCGARIDVIPKYFYFSFHFNTSLLVSFRGCVHREHLTAQKNGDDVFSIFCRWVFFSINIAIRFDLFSMNEIYQMNKCCSQFSVVFFIFRRSKIGYEI